MPCRPAAVACSKHAPVLRTHLGGQRGASRRGDVWQSQPLAQRMGAVHLHFHLASRPQHPGMPDVRIPHLQRGRVWRMAQGSDMPYTQQKVAAHATCCHPARRLTKRGTVTTVSLWLTCSRGRQVRRSWHEETACLQQ